MAGLTVVAEMIGMIGQAARLAASDLAKATEAAKTYKETVASTTSSMGKAAGSGPSGMGSSDGGSPVDTNALGAALQITKGRLR